MKSEYLLKAFAPSSVSLSHDIKSTAPDKHTGMDTAAMLAMVGDDAQFGLHAFLAKHDVSKADKIKTIEALTQYALKTAPVLVVKAAGNKLAPCMMILAKMAFEDYARSAGSTGECTECQGKGMVYCCKPVVKHPGIINRAGEVVIGADIREEMVGETCRMCKGKGKIAYRCACKGRGKIPDIKQTELQGVPVFRNCPRCSGRGYKRMPSSVAYAAIKHLVPELTQPSWSRNWKGYYESLIGQCYLEERQIDWLLKQVAG
ncbi:antitermination protein [Morganella psychrotolerans]|uniref:Molecular chaperone n=1 Tax=Morganella psychrotolerans TaxID=368603 RepID=A0A1B8HEA3_9GAMM|nr:antitermination protein [Morganella psychrotolerans]OBU07417.1 molecular chaperone [Morganella psychrotolerans]